MATIDALRKRIDSLLEQIEPKQEPIMIIITRWGSTDEDMQQALRGEQNPNARIIKTQWAWSE